MKPINRCSFYLNPNLSNETDKKTINNSYNHTKYLRMHTILISELDMDWYYEFVERSEQSGRNGEPLSMNYISTHIKKIKRVMRYAEDKDHAVNSSYKSTSFKAPQETASEIYLNEEELSQIRAPTQTDDHSE